MFRLFGNWNTYLTKEIREGKHLDKAQKTDYKEFFEKSTFKRLSQWTILWVEENTVYWGKANQDKVDKYCFFRTNKKSIEENFASLDAAKKKSLILILEKYVGDFLDEIDGCISALESSSYEQVEIADDTNFHIVLNVDLSVRSTGLNAKPHNEKATFDFLLHPHNFDLIQLKRLK